MRNTKIKVLSYWPNGQLWPPSSDEKTEKRKRREPAHFLRSRYHCARLLTPTGNWKRFSSKVEEENGKKEEVLPLKEEIAERIEKVKGTNKDKLIASPQSSPLIENMVARQITTRKTFLLFVGAFVFTFPNFDWDFDS